MTSDAATAVWLYGSFARGDADALSDVDALVVSSEDEMPTLSHLHPILAQASISRYRWDEMERMATSGSLFLRHLGSEGIPLWESHTAKGRLAEILGGLGHYLNVDRDLRAFDVVLGDVRSSLANGAVSIPYELATLGTIVRHASILGCYLAGRPTYSRTEPVATLVDAWDLPPEWALEFPALYAFRLYAANRLPKPPYATANFATEWCIRAEALLKVLGAHANDGH
jgi:hypothetical protein